MIKSYNLQLFDSILYIIWVLYEIDIVWVLYCVGILTFFNGILGNYRFYSVFIG